MKTTHPAARARPGAPRLRMPTATPRRWKKRAYASSLCVQWICARPPSPDVGQICPLHRGKPRQLLKAPVVAVMPPMRTTRALRTKAATMPPRPLSRASGRAVRPPSTPARRPSTTSVARRPSPVPRCSTTVWDGSSSFTARAPSRDCKTSSPSARSAGRTVPPRPDAPGSFRLASVTSTTAKTSSPSPITARRWPNSITTSALSSVGMIWPLHVGQSSPHPMPEPVIRTMKPITITA